MQDPRWSQLAQALVESGWSWRDDALYAPHETLWFATSADNPNFAQFRDRMSVAGQASSTSADLDFDRAALNADLRSLVAALDAVLAN
jgi:hypothetical protein